MLSISEYTPLEGLDAHGHKQEVTTCVSVGNNNGKIEQYTLTLFFFHSTVIRRICNNVLNMSLNFKAVKILTVTMLWYK